MRKFVAGVVLVIFAVSPVFAGKWEDNGCAGCHNGQMRSTSGKPIPSRDQLKKKFKTVDEFVKAAKAATDPMMSSFKNDAVLKPVAKEVLGK